MPDQIQRMGHAVQRHPVDVLLPALPPPERHRVSEGHGVEVVADAQSSLEAPRRHIGQLRGDLEERCTVPGEVGTGEVLEGMGESDGGRGG